MDLDKENINSPDSITLLNYINEKANKEEQIIIEHWLNDNSDNEKELVQLALLCDIQRTRQRIRSRNTTRALRKVEYRIRQKARRKWLRQVAVAASIIIGILGVGSFVWQHQQNKKISFVTVYTNAGMRSQVELPDGTTVHLNANSKLVYPERYYKGNRKVRLSGEAYFEVVHNDRQPFIVSTTDDRVHVTVLGTKFNMRAYQSDNTVQTTLVEGSVRLQIEGKKGSIMLKPDDLAVYEIVTGNVYMEKTHPEHEIAWKDGRLIFKETPMTEVLKRLTHFYSVDFAVEDEVIHSYTFTGTFENKPLFQILDYMKLSSKIKYTMSYPENQEVKHPVVRLSK